MGFLRVSGNVFLVLGLAIGCGGDDKPDSGAGGGSAGKGGASNEAGGRNEAGTAGGSGKGQGGSPTGGTGGSAGGGNAGASGEAGGGGEGGEGGDGGQSPIAFVSKPAGVELIVDDAAKALGFTLRSSNLTQKAAGAQFYKEWFAEVFNGSDEPQCYIQVVADFQSASGVSLLKMDTFASGAAFSVGASGLPATCAAPGETVPMWGNDLDTTSVALDSVTKLRVKIVALARPAAVPHPSTPVLLSSSKNFDKLLGWWTFSGTAKATADIYNVQLEFWGKSGGLVVGKSAAFHSESWLKGESWSFETLAGIESAQLETALPYFGFIDGLKKSLRVVYQGENLKLAELCSAATASWQATEERRARAK